MFYGDNAKATNFVAITGRIKIEKRGSRAFSGSIATCQGVHGDESPC